MSFYKEGYYFVPWREAKKKSIVDGEDIKANYLEHDVPENAYCETLGQLGDNGREGYPSPYICFVRWPKGGTEPPGMKPVPDDLEKLLRAGRAYKPAIAIANKVRHQPGSKNWTEAEEVEKFTSSLRYELDHQREKPFFLAKALQYDEQYDEDGYRCPGDYVWIVGYRPDRKEPIQWVTSLYLVYTGAVADFDVDVAYLAERFAVRPKPGI